MRTAKSLVFVFVFAILMSGASAVQYINQAGGANLSIGNSNNIFIDNTNNRVGIFDTDPAQPLDITGNIAVAGTTVITSSRVLRAQNGNVGTAAISFSSDTDTGLYRVGADQLGLTVGGTQRAVVNSSGLAITSGGLLIGSTQVIDSSRVGSFATGTTINSQTVWHAGNDGSGSTLDADLLDGQSGGYYQDAGNINAGTLALARGGTGSSLSDPGADRIVFWDDSGTTVTWLTVGSGLTLSGTTLSATGGVVSEAAGWTNTTTTVSLTDSADNVSAGVLYVDNANSRVGVGDTTPSARLEIGANGALNEEFIVRSQNFSGIHLIGDSANGGSGEPGGAYVLLSQDAQAVQGIFGVVQNNGGDGSPGGSFTNSLGNSVILGNKYAGDLQLGTSNAVRMTINGSGSIGIGDTTPSQILDIDGTNGQILVEESTTEFLRVGVGETANTAIIGWDDADSLRLGVYASPTDTTITDRVTIAANGRVGINDTSPTNTLDVTGAIGIGDTTVISAGRVGSFATGTTINGQTAWHAGNDGAASTLDADLLDGQEGSYYRDAGNLNAGTVASARISGSYTGITGVGTIATGTWQGTALTNAYVADAITVNGGTIGSNTISAGSTWTTAGTLTIGDGGDVININSSTWDVTNGAISGVTTLDTGQGANELYAMNQNVRTTDAVSFATINTGSGAMELGDAAVTNGDTNSIPTGDQVYDFVTGLGYVSGEADTLATVTARGATTATAVSFTSVSNPGVTIGNGTHGYLAIGASGWYDDGTYLSPLGSRSFYIRDTVGTSYLYSANTYLGSQTGDTIHTRGNTINFGDTTYNTTMNVRLDGATNDVNFFYGGTQVGQISAQDTTWFRINQDVARNIYTPRYFRADEGLFVDGVVYGINGTGVLHSNTGATVGGNTIWHAGNDGSGSGLDADTLDGVNEGTFFRLDQAETVTGRPAFNGGTSGSTSPFTVDSNTVVTNLNADLLDGLSEASFFRLNQAETVSARPAFNGGTSGVDSPFTVDSTFVVTNLNADLLDGQNGAYYQPASTALTTSTSWGGDLTGTGSSPTIAANSVALGTDTTGNYAGSSSEGGAATTALALNANPGNCAAGNYPLGIAANGAVESCTADDDTPDSDAEVPNAITVSGGTIGSNSISSASTWTTLGTLTIGDGGDRIDINSNTWDVANGVFSGGTWQGTAIADTYVADAITVSGGTLGSNTIGSAAAWTVTNTLNIDSNTLYIDGTNNRVGILDSTPSQALDVTGNIAIGGTTAITSGRLFRGANGALATPTFSFTNDVDTGMYLVGTANLSIVAASTQRINVDGNTGNVVITVG